MFLIAVERLDCKPNSIVFTPSKEEKQEGMVAIPLFYRHGHETKLPVCLLGPSSRGKGLQEDWNGGCSLPATQLWVLCEPGMAHTAWPSRNRSTKQHQSNSTETKRLEPDTWFSASVQPRLNHFDPVQTSLIAPRNLFPICL